MKLRGTGYGTNQQNTVDLLEQDNIIYELVKLLADHEYLAQISGIDIFQDIMQYLVGKIDQCVRHVAEVDNASDCEMIREVVFEVSIVYGDYGLDSRRLWNCKSG